MEKRLAAILISDIVAYTKLMEEDTEGTVMAWSDARLRWTLGGIVAKIEARSGSRGIEPARILCAVLAPYDEVVSLPVFDPLHIMPVFAMVKDDVASFVIDACALAVSGGCFDVAGTSSSFKHQFRALKTIV